MGGQVSLDFFVLCVVNKLRVFSFFLPTNLYITITAGALLTVYNDISVLLNATILKTTTVYYQVAELISVTVFKSNLSIIF